LNLALLGISEKVMLARELNELEEETIPQPFSLHPLSSQHVTESKHLLQAKSSRFSEGDAVLFKYADTIKSTFSHLLDDRDLYVSPVSPATPPVQHVFAHTKQVLPQHWLATDFRRRRKKAALAYTHCKVVDSGLVQRAALHQERESERTHVLRQALQNPQPTQRFITEAGGLNALSASVNNKLRSRPRQARTHRLMRPSQQQALDKRYARTQKLRRDRLASQWDASIYKKSNNSYLSNGHQQRVSARGSPKKPLPAAPLIDAHAFVESATGKSAPVISVKEAAPLIESVIPRRSWESVVIPNPGDDCMMNSTIHTHQLVPADMVPLLPQLARDVVQFPDLSHITNFPAPARMLLSTSWIANRGADLKKQDQGMQSSKLWQRPQSPAQFFLPSKPNLQNDLKTSLSGAAGNLKWRYQGGKLSVQNGVVRSYQQARRRPQQPKKVQVATVPSPPEISPIPADHSHLSGPELQKQHRCHLLRAQRHRLIKKASIRKEAKILSARKASSFHTNADDVASVKRAIVAIDAELAQLGQ
jgi:hypothetical protein